MSTNRWRLRELEKRIAPVAADDGARLDVAFRALCDRIDPDTRAVVRAFARHERGVGVRIDAWERIRRQAFHEVFGCRFETRDGKAVRVVCDAPSGGQFVRDLMAEATRWNRAHPQACPSCEAQLVRARDGFDA